MSARETLLAKLHERGDLALFETPSSVRIEPLVPGGFCVTLATPDDREAIVFLGDECFHQHFDEEDEALDFIAWCFSGEARLREKLAWRDLAEDRLGDPRGRKLDEVHDLRPVDRSILEEPDRANSAQSQAVSSLSGR